MYQIGVNLIESTNSTQPLILKPSTSTVNSGGGGRSIGMWKGVENGRVKFPKEDD